MSIQLPPSGKPDTAHSGKASTSSAEAAVSRAQQALAKLVGQVSKAEVIKVTQTTGQDATSRLTNQQLNSQQQQTQVQAQLRATQSSQNTVDTLLKISGATADKTAQSTTMPYQLTLRIGQQQFQVASPIALKVGEEILLKILNTREFSLLKSLQPQQQTPASDNAKLIQSATALQSALRTLLPRINEQSRLLDLIQQLPPGQLQTLSPQNQNSIASLREFSLPVTSLQQALNTSSEQTRLVNTIRQALQNSGVFQASAAHKLALKPGDAVLAPGKSSTTADTAYKLPEIIRQSIATWFQEKSPFKTVPADSSTSSTSTTTLAKTADKNPQALLKPGSQATEQRSADTLKSATQELSQQLLGELLSVAMGNKTGQAEIAKLPGDLSSQLRRAADLLRQHNSVAEPAKESSKLPVTQREQSLLMLTLLRESLSSLVRTQLHQLTSLNMQQQAPESQQHHWFTEIPVQWGQHTQQVQIQLDEESRQQQHQGQRQWKVMLRFDLEKLGTLFVRLIMVGDTVKTTLWAESILSQRFIRRQLDELEQGLKKVGVNVETIECLCGTPPDPRVQVQQSLIDIKT